MHLEECHLASVTSTNDYAKELLRSHAAVFVTALHQTRGRGRNGREWLGDYGLNAYCSIGIRHEARISTEEASSYMGLGALVILHTLRAIAPFNPYRLKYPNDVQALTAEGWAKIGGTLVEHEFQGDRCVTTVIGMGVNVGQKVFPQTIDQAVTSLFLLGRDIALSSFIVCLRDIALRYLEMPWRIVHDEWKQELKLDGMEVRIIGSDDKWSVRNVLMDGRLEVYNSVTNTTRVLTDGESVRYEDRAEQR